jgi:hypothetical protein
MISLNKTAVFAVLAVLAAPASAACPWSVNVLSVPSEGSIKLTFVSQTRSGRLSTISLRRSTARGPDSMGGAASMAFCIELSIS